jgi:hypothetical protein
MRSDCGLSPCGTAGISPAKGASMPQDLESKQN